MEIKHGPIAFFLFTGKILLLSPSGKLFRKLTASRKFFKFISLFQFINFHSSISSILINISSYCISLYNSINPGDNNANYIINEEFSKKLDTYNKKGNNNRDFDDDDQKKTSWTDRVKKGATKLFSKKPSCDDTFADDEKPKKNKKKGKNNGTNDDQPTNLLHFENTKVEFPDNDPYNRLNINEYTNSIKRQSDSHRQL